MENPISAKDIQELLARNLRAAREKLGISQMKLAERANLSAGYMNDVEGARRWMSVETLARLARALHLKPYQLFAENDDSAIDTHTMLASILSEAKEAVGTQLERVIMSRALTANGVEANRRKS